MENHSDLGGNGMHRGENGSSPNRKCISEASSSAPSGRSHNVRSMATSVSHASELSIALGKATAFFLPAEFQVPRSIVRRAFQSIDQMESPDSPGEVSVGALFAAVHRFQKAFGQGDANRYFNDNVLLVDLGLDDGQFDPDMRIVWSVECVYKVFTVQLTPLERLYFTLDMAENSSITSKMVSITIFVAVVLSLTCWIAGTVEGVRVPPPNCTSTSIDACVPEEPPWMQVIETVCVWIFTAEILGRLLSVGHARRELLNQRLLISVISGEVEEGDRRNRSRSHCVRLCSFLLSPSALFDILSVVPYWVEMWITTGNVAEIEALRVLYLARVTRIFKLGRALNADLGQLNEVHDLFRKVLVNASPAILMTVLLIMIALFFFGTFIWFCERGEWVTAQDPRSQGQFVTGPGAWMRQSRDRTSWELSPFESIPSAFWWTFVTISTVGYGDQVPYTTPGKIVGSIAMLYGTVILGLPLFVVGATFGQEYDRLMKAAKRRQDALNSRESRLQKSHLFTDKTQQYKKTAQLFVDEYSSFSKAIEDASPSIGVPFALATTWLDTLRAALVDSVPAVALDRLSVRVLSRLAEAEEICAAASACSPDESPSYAVSASVACCRRARLSWHKLALTCCQLDQIPQEMLQKTLAEVSASMPGITSSKELQLPLRSSLCKLSAPRPKASVGRTGSVPRELASSPMQSCDKGLDNGMHTADLSGGVSRIVAL
mmetsp:Transcript_64364/g.167173  ORF Transcript_64364/g.167173 Transcript_64364/m.167173 type:complete len:718 (+) Transcript_64364:42-2195(+)